jgi:hypothetical protein
LHTLRSRQALPSGLKLGFGQYPVFSLPFDHGRKPVGILSASRAARVSHAEMLEPSASDEALDTAYQLALEQLRDARTSSSSPE